MTGRADLWAGLKLTLIISRGEAAPRAVIDLAEAAFAGGVTALQLREKYGPTDRALFEQALELRGFCRERGRLFLVNDRLDLALAVEADGLHIGQQDLPAAAAARILPKSMLLGVSARTTAQAQMALAAGADYLGVGAFFPTGSKTEAEVVDREAVREIVALGAPVVAIGGLTEANAAEAWGLGVAGLAVISALAQARDPREAAAGLLCRPAV